MEKLPTKRLLAYKKKWLKNPDYPHSYEDFIWDCNCSICTDQKNKIKEYNETYKNIISILNTREHIKRKGKK